MIFSNLRHIRMIRNGLAKYHLPADNLNIPIDTWIVKTQTRRINRGTYKVGRTYAVQRKRGAKAEPDIRIVMDRIWESEFRVKSLNKMQGQKEDIRRTSLKTCLQGYILCGGWQEVGGRSSSMLWKKRGED